MKDMDIWTQESSSTPELRDDDVTSRTVSLKQAGRLHDIAEQQDTSVNRVVNSLIELGISCFYDNRNLLTPEMQNLRAKAQSFENFQLQHNFVRTGIEIVDKVLDDPDVYGKMQAIIKSRSLSPADALFLMIKYACRAKPSTLIDAIE